MSAQIDGSVDALPYPWPHDRSLAANNTALLVIDMQRDFCEQGGYLSLQGYDVQHFRDLIPKIRDLLSAFRRRGFQILHTTEGHRPDLSDLSRRELYRSMNNASNTGIGSTGPLGRVLVRGEPGHDTIPELYPLAEETVIDKPGKSSFNYTDLDLILRDKGIRNLVLCGVTTDVCVHSTMRDANDMGYDCLLVSDACAAAEQDLHDAAVKSVTMEGGVFGAVATVKHVIDAVNDIVIL